MIERQKTKPAALSATASSFARIDTFFDRAEHILERSDYLIMKAKSLIFGLAFFLFLFFEMFQLAQILLNKHLN